MSGIDGLTVFLLDRIAEDEAVHPQRGFLMNVEHHDNGCDLIAAHSDGPACDCGGPKRWLAECEAKRRIVMRCGMLLDSWDHIHDGVPELAPFPDVNRRERHHATETLSDLALRYADHPDYRQEWKP